VSQFPYDMDLILVAIMPNPRDLEIARMFGWYRIPLKSAPKVIAVDYLAFYQTGIFGEDNRWRIKMIAPVKGHELTTRNSLIRSAPDHPRANEEYFKIQIGPLVNLDRPIVADQWRRITFLGMDNQGVFEQDFSDWNLNFLKLLSDWEEIKESDSDYV